MCSLVDTPLSINLLHPNIIHVSLIVLLLLHQALLYIRKRSLFKGNRKGLDELNEEEALEKSRTFIERWIFISNFKL